MTLFSRSAHSQVGGRTAAFAVRVTDSGYEPDTVVLPAGQATRIAFTRETASPCAAEVTFPDLGVSATLPIGEKVLVDLPPVAAGEHAFECSMGMLHGRLIVAEDAGGCPTVAADPITAKRGSR